jgi:hypothetical protein
MRLPVEGGPLRLINRKVFLIKIVVRRVSEWEQKKKAIVLSSVRLASTGERMQYKRYRYIAGFNRQMRFYMVFGGTEMKYRPPRVAEL